MAIIKPGKNDLWFRIQRRINPDREEELFCANKGIFSDESELGFTKHEARLTALKNHPFYQKYNGNKIREIRKEEPFWF